jgi:TRAP-type C4-dicarboxylate transport system permease small subunit
MQILCTLIKPLERANDIAGQVGRNLSVLAMALMVVIILTQVFFRYALNNALPWPDEAARFLMLWLAGLMGPIAMRRGSMVAITSLHNLLPGILCQLLILFLLLLSLLVLMVAINLGWGHVNSGWLFSSSSLKLPLHLIGMKAVKIKLAWSYMSLFVGYCLMFLVNLELVLRVFITLLGGSAYLKPLQTEQQAGFD